MGEWDTYRRESPGPICYGFFLTLSWHASKAYIELS
jgi:hypothetical protein